MFWIIFMTNIYIHFHFVWLLFGKIMQYSYKMYISWINRVSWVIDLNDPPPLSSAKQKMFCCPKYFFGCMDFNKKCTPFTKDPLLIYKNKSQIPESSTVLCGEFLLFLLSFLWNLLKMFQKTQVLLVNRTKASQKRSSEL